MGGEFLSRCKRGCTIVWAAPFKESGRRVEALSATNKQCDRRRMRIEAPLSVTYATRGW